MMNWKLGVVYKLHRFSQGIEYKKRLSAEKQILKINAEPGYKILYGPRFPDPVAELRNILIKSLGIGTT